VAQKKKVKGADFVIEIDDARLEALLRHARSPIDLKVGIIGSAAKAPHPGTALTTAEVAARHELGAGVPRRSWLRDWVEEDKEQIRLEWIRAMQNAVIADEPFGVHIGRMGLVLVGRCQQRIANRIPPPNADSTIRRKGSDVPLIDTGQLRTSITSEVNDPAMKKRLAEAKRKVAAARKAQRKAERRRRQLKKARRKLAKVTKRATKTVRRGTKKLARNARRTRKSVVRSIKRNRRALTRAVRRQGRAVTRAVRQGRRSLQRALRPARRRRRR
jgi:hypothetical protein